MKDDLISRKALIERYGELCHSFLDVIEAMPSVEAEPVRHGQWEHGMQCPFCKQIDTTKPNYCPNCGAKMDGGKRCGYRDS